MASARRGFLMALGLALAAGLLIGWFYSAPLRGLLVAALLVIAWFVWQLLRFEHAVLHDKLEDVMQGDGIWSRIASRIHFLRQRSRKHKRRYRRLLREVRNSTNAMPDGGIVLDRDLQIVLGNQAARDLAGIRMPQDRGQRIDNILRNPLFVEYLKSEHDGRAVEIPSPLVEQNWLSCRLLPFGLDQQLLLIRDVTETFRVNTMRRDFVANASHELRSPLTVISGYLDTMAEADDAPESWRRPLQQMHTQAERMNRVVAELLELSRLENPQSVREEQEVDIGALMALARRGYSGQAGIASIETESSLSAHLLGVSTEIESVISNLLVNAVRHTAADGKITLSWHANADGSACLEVADTGEGIAVEHIPRLTERFFRVDPGRSRDSGGVGLGLSIVKHALMRHDASLEIESAAGKGSRFICHFPAARLIGADPIAIGGTSKIH